MWRVYVEALELFKDTFDEAGLNQVTKRKNIFAAESLVSHVLFQ